VGKSAPHQTCYMLNSQKSSSPFSCIVLFSQWLCWGKYHRNQKKKNKIS
jgi:hypothetical protein